MKCSSSTGIVGGLLFCGFFFGIFRGLRRAMRARPEKRDRWETQALIAALAGAALGGIPEYIWFYPRILFFLVRPLRHGARRFGR